MSTNDIKGRKWRSRGLRASAAAWIPAGRVSDRNSYVLLNECVTDIERGADELSGVYTCVEEVESGVAENEQQIWWEACV